MSFQSKVLIKKRYLDGYKTEVWDPCRPKRIGPKFQWVIEKTSSGFIIQNLKEAVYREVSFDEIGKDRLIELPSSEESADDRTVVIEPTRGLSPAYHSTEGAVIDVEKAPHLVVYSCIGPWILSAQRMTSATIAYVRGTPIFTLKRNGNDFDILCHIDGLQVRTPAHKAGHSRAGDRYMVSERDLAKTLIKKGKRRWLFRAHPIAPGLMTGLKVLPPITTESRWFATVSSLMLGALFSLFVIARSMHFEEPKVELVKEPPPVVKVALPQKLIPPEPKPLIEKKTEVVKLKESLTPGKPKMNRGHQPEKLKKEVGGLAVKKPPKPLDLSKLQGALSLVSDSPVSGQVSDQAQKKNRPSEAKDIFNSKAPGYVSTPVNNQMVKPNVDVSQVGGVPGADYTYTKSNAITGAAGPGNYVSIEDGGSVFDEGLTKEEVDNVVKAHIQEVQQCHRVASEGTGGVEGKVSVDFVINAAGVATGAKIGASSVSNSVLGECLVSRVKSWRFPKPVGGVNVKISYPFFFRVLGR